MAGDLDTSVSDVSPRMTELVSSLQDSPLQIDPLYLRCATATYEHTDASLTEIRFWFTFTTEPPNTINHLRTLKSNLDFLDLIYSNMTTSLHVNYPITEINVGESSF